LPSSPFLTSSLSFVGPTLCHLTPHSEGCPAVVSNLWDVTDRDIDRFCEALLGTWLGPKMTEVAS